MVIRKYLAITYFLKQTLCFFLFAIVCDKFNSLKKIMSIHFFICVLDFRQDGWRDHRRVRVDSFV